MDSDRKVILEWGRRPAGALFGLPWFSRGEETGPRAAEFAAGLTEVLAGERYATEAFALNGHVSEVRWEFVLGGWVYFVAIARRRGEAPLLPEVSPRLAHWRVAPHPRSKGVSRHV